MNYKYIPIGEDKKTYKIQGQAVRYEKIYKEKEIEGIKVSSQLFGDIQTKETEEKSSAKLLLERKMLGVEPLKAKVKFFQRVVGYVPCVNEEGNIGWLRIIGKSKSKIISLLLIIVLLLGSGWYYIKHQGPELDSTAIAYQMPEGLINQDPTQIMIPGYDVIEVDKETMSTEVMLLNPEGNTCYFQYQIRLTETQEVLYETKLLEAGSAIPGFTLNKELEEGEYEVEVVINTFDSEDYEQALNGGVVDATIKVE